MTLLNRGNDKRAVASVCKHILATVLFLFVMVFHFVLAQQNEIIDNEKIVELTKVGIRDDVLIQKIRQSRVMLDGSQDALLQLKGSGVSDAVIVELLTRAKSNGFLAQGPVKDYTVIPFGTEVKVLTRGKLTSKKLQIGQKLALEIAEDVQLNGKLIISKGTNVAAVVVDSRKSGMMGRSGRLAIYIESTTMVNGQSIRLRAGQGGRNGDNMRTMFALTVMFGAPGLLMKGTNGQIPANSIIVAQIDETKYTKFTSN